MSDLHNFVPPVRSFAGDGRKRTAEEMTISSRSITPVSSAPVVEVISQLRPEMDGKTVDGIYWILRARLRQCNIGMSDIELHRIARDIAVRPTRNQHSA